MTIEEKELVIKAARAIGYVLHNDKQLLFFKSEKDKANKHYAFYFNPLENPNDALNLQLKLGISVLIENNKKAISAMNYDGPLISLGRVYVFENSKESAYCWAITQLAAAIYEDKKNNASKKEQK